MFSSRITPARAGNSHYIYCPRARLQDHPRACGEQGGGKFLGSLMRGSPPRVRGTGKGYGGLCVLSRITPARAGNSRLMAACDREMADHPRACGEQDDNKVYPEDEIGSPPRVRGTEGDDRTAGGVHRITPARAGNSKLNNTPGEGAKDHPRACGEQGAGSHDGCRNLGITPARAGNRDRTDTPTRGTKDHPRACGEQDLCFILGQSPILCKHHLRCE